MSYLHERSAEEQQAFIGYLVRRYLELFRPHLDIVFQEFENELARIKAARKKSK